MCLYDHDESRRILKLAEMNISKLNENLKEI